MIQKEGSPKRLPSLLERRGRGLLVFMPHLFSHLPVLVLAYLFSSLFYNATHSGLASVKNVSFYYS